MGYDLKLLLASDEQLHFMRASPEYTRHFIEGRRPTRTTTETVGSWFRKKDITVTTDVEMRCAWPDSPPAAVQLLSRAGIYYLLNGTNDNVEHVTNFPNVGGRYRKEMLGPAVELGEAYLGHAHAFASTEVQALKKALDAIDSETISARAKHISSDLEWEDALTQAPEDMKALRSFIDRAASTKSGMVWYWA